MPEENTTEANSTADANEVAPTPKDVAESTKATEPDEDSATDKDNETERDGNAEQSSGEPDDPQPSDIDDNVAPEEDETSGQEAKALRRSLTRKNKENETLRARAKTAEGKLARYEAAANAGLPIDLAGRLQGETPQELEADAKKLIEQFGLRHLIQDTVKDGVGRSSSGNEEDNLSLSQLGARIYGR